MKNVFLASVLVIVTVAVAQTGKETKKASSSSAGNVEQQLIQMEKDWAQAIVKGDEATLEHERQRIRNQRPLYRYLGKTKWPLAGGGVAGHPDCKVVTQISKFQGFKVQGFSSTYLFTINNSIPPCPSCPLRFNLRFS